MFWLSLTKFPNSFWDEKVVNMKSSEGLVGCIAPKVWWRASQPTFEFKFWSATP